MLAVDHPNPSDQTVLPIGLDRMKAEVPGIHQLQVPGQESAVVVVHTWGWRLQLRACIQQDHLQLGILRLQLRPHLRPLQSRKPAQHTGVYPVVLGEMEGRPHVEGLQMVVVEKQGLGLVRSLLVVVHTEVARRTELRVGIGTAIGRREGQEVVRT